MARTSYDRDDDERPSTAVVNAIAEHEDASTDDVSPQLYDVVDPDALDALFATRVDGQPRTRGRAVFTYRGHRVTVHADGHVSVSDLDEIAGSQSAVADE